MPNTFHLIHPDIELPTGRTKKLVDELISNWRAGENSGGGEIAAVAALLSDTSELCNIYKIKEGLSNHKFLSDVSDFLKAQPPQSSPFVERVKQDHHWQTIPLYVIGVSSATCAIYAALSAASVAGGEVITTSLNYIGIPNAIVMAGALPRFVDIDPRTWCMDVKSCESALSKKTKAIILTHINALADLEPFYDLFKRKGLEIPLIQDASLAIGSIRHAVRPGLINIGPAGITVMSLSVSKIISGLGGAIVAANDPNVLGLIYEISHQGLSDADPGNIASFGGNFKLSALNTMIAYEHFKRRESIFKRRRELAKLYELNLRPLVKSGRIGLQEGIDEAVITHFCVTLPVSYASVADLMWNRYRIQIGMWHVHHKQEIYRILLRPRVPKLPCTEKLANKFAFLPFHAMISNDDVAFICRSLIQVLDELEVCARNRKGNRPL